MFLADFRVSQLITHFAKFSCPEQSKKDFSVFDSIWNLSARLQFELVMRSCVLGKDTLGLFFISAKHAVHPLRWPSLTKDLQTEPKTGYVSLLWLDRSGTLGLDISHGGGSNSFASQMYFKQRKCEL